MQASPARLANLRRMVGAFLVDGFFRQGSRLAQLHPNARPETHGVEVIRDVAYTSSGAMHHLLDVYRPVGLKAGANRPAILYVHGGGFRILSKDSHWIMGLAFARRGYVVFNVNYRLAPQHRYPAALEDCAAAYAWVAAHAGEFGGDIGRLVLAGESAGANLVAAIAVAACFARPEPFAQTIFDVGVAPRAVLPACGIFQVSDVGRFARRRPIAPFIADRLHEVADNYLPREGESSISTELADPLLVLERGERPERPLPPFFLPCGTKDPLLDDTRRMGRALAALGVDREVHIYPGELHAFHALVWRPRAKQCWRDTYAFLDRVIGTVG
ncbi:MAG: alpha/beta hydrolase [Polyangiaceae bacterium]